MVSIYDVGSATVGKLVFVPQLVFCVTRVLCDDKPYWSMIPLSFLKLSAISLTPVYSVKFVVFFGSANALVTLFLAQQLVFLCFARIFCNDKPYRYWSMILLSFLKLSAISSTPVYLVKILISFRIRQQFGNIVLSTTTRFSVFCLNLLWWQFFSDPWCFRAF